MPTIDGLSYTFIAISPEGKKRLKLSHKDSQWMVRRFTRKCVMKVNDMDMDISISNIWSQMEP